MLLFIDPATVQKARFLTEARDLLDVRRYYLVPRPGQPDALIVTRAGLVLESLTNQRVDASIGWDTAQPGFATEDQIGQERTKITIRRVVRDARRCPSLAETL